MSLSDTTLRRILDKPYSGKREITDGEGLSVRVTPLGVITFQFRYRWRGTPVRLSLGRYPAISLRDARILVGKLRERYAAGVNPNTYFSSKINEALTVDECMARWWDSYAVTLRENTQTLYKYSVMEIMKGVFPDTPVHALPVSAWVQLFEQLEKENPKKARRTLTQVRAVMNWCIGRQLIPSCEVLKLSVKSIGKKPDIGQRVLTYTELATIWLALENSKLVSSNRVLHQLLLLWGARLSELRLSRVEDFNLNDSIWTTPANTSKMGNIIRRPIFKQITPYVEKLVYAGNTILFPGQTSDKPLDLSSCNYYMRNIRGLINVPAWRTHDFRRSLVTNLSQEGVMPHVTEKMLGHELGGVMAVYNKHDWLDDQKDAYELYADKIFWHANQLKRG